MEVDPIIVAKLELRIVAIGECDLIMGLVWRFERKVRSKVNDEHYEYDSQ